MLVNHRLGKTTGRCQKKQLSDMLLLLLIVLTALESLELCRCTSKLLYKRLLSTCHSIVDSCRPSQHLWRPAHLVTSQEEG